MKHDPFRSRFDGQRGFVGGEGERSGPFFARPPLSDLGPQILPGGEALTGWHPVRVTLRSGPLVRGVYGGPVIVPLAHAMGLMPLGIFGEGFDLIRWAEEAARDVGEFFAEAGQWVAAAWEDLKNFVDDAQMWATIGAGILGTVGAVLCATGIGAGLGAACISGSIAIGEAVFASQVVETAIVETVDPIIEKVEEVSATVSVYAKASAGALEAGAAMQAKVQAIYEKATGKPMPAPTEADRQSPTYRATRILTEALLRLSGKNPLLLGLSPMQILMGPQKYQLPPEVQVLVLWAANVPAVAQGPGGMKQLGAMTSAIGDWLTRKTEYVNDATFARLAVAFKLESALTAVSDFSKLLPGQPPYLQFEATEGWVQSMASASDAGRVAEVQRLIAKYPEAEVVDALAVLVKRRVNLNFRKNGLPDIEWARTIYKAPTEVVQLYAAPPVDYSLAVNLALPGAQISYDMAMRGSMGARLGMADKVDYLVATTLANLSSSGTQSFLPVFWKNLLGSEVFWPPTPSPGAIGIGADRLSVTVTGTGPAKPDPLKVRSQLESYCRTLKSWASGYRQNAAEYQKRLEEQRAAEKASYEAQEKAALELVRLATEEGTKAQAEQQERTREGVLVSAGGTPSPGTFLRVGNGLSVVVLPDGAADLGSWQLLPA